MSSPDISTTANQFKLAAASYFGVPADQLVTGKQEGSFVLVLRIALTPQDVTSIGVRMAEMGKDAEQFQPDGLAGTWQEADKRDEPPHESNIRSAYECLTDAERARYGTFEQFVEKRNKSHAAFEKPFILPTRPASNTRNDTGETEFVSGPTEGVGGRKVQHVDVPEQQDAVSELPAAVWVADADVELPQALSYSDVRTVGGGREYLLQVDMLTPEQKSKYGVQS